METFNCPKCGRATPTVEAAVTKNRGTLWCRTCYRAAVSTGRKGRRLSRDPMAKGNDYRSRNAILRGLGFESYAAYLASELWRQVRARVYAIKGRSCYLCGEPATELHHNRYHVNDLTGKRLRYINPICRGCHEGIEFEGGAKVRLSRAKRAFRKRRKAHLKGA